MAVVAMLTDKEQFILKIAQYGVTIVAGAGTVPQGGGVSSTGTLNTVAAKLSASSGSDLVIAALARYAIALGRETVSRGDILREMKTATSYYKQTYSKNLSGSLSTLVAAQRIREVASDTYALSADELTKLRTALAS